MFQSSRTASGSARLQASSACSPSSLVGAGAKLDETGEHDRCFHGTESRDLAQIAGAGERNALPTLFFALNESLGALLTRGAEEAERRGEILGGEATLFGEARGRQVIGVAIGGNLGDLDQPLLDAALEVGVGEAERDAEIAGDRALGERAVFLNRIEEPERDRGLGVQGPAVGALVFKSGQCVGGGIAVGHAPSPRSWRELGGL